MSERTEDQLIPLAQKGDANAIGELYDRHHQHIFRYIWSRTSNQRVAEDLTGEVFIRMVGHLSNYEDRGIPFRVWLYRIAANLVKDHYRQTSNQPTLPLEHATEVKASMSSPDVVVEATLTVEKVKQALATIDPAQRDVVILRFLAGMSLKEVAQTLDRSVGAVKSLQHRGLAALRVALQEG